MTLPWTITASEEALKTIPDSYREGALALGATKWQAIRTNVLPYAVPGMLTGTVLGLARAAGETAPIMFTGAAFYLPYLPKSLSDQFMALPYHLYIMATQHHASKVRRWPTGRPSAYPGAELRPCHPLRCEGAPDMSAQVKIKPRIDFYYGANRPQGYDRMLRQGSRPSSARPDAENRPSSGRSTG
jgi:hypothetical protein